MATLLLVHGAWHGAWCWNALTPLLFARGHRVLTVDLRSAGDDPDTVARATLQDGVGQVCAAAEGAGEELWLVGHSLGGLTVAQASEPLAERLRGVVYVTAVLPQDGQNTPEALGRANPGPLDDAMEIDPERGIARLDVERSADAFFEFCAPEQVAFAKARLAPLQNLAMSLTPVRLSPERGARVSRFYVECLRDRVLRIDLQRGMHGRAGVKGVHTLDTDHSPFFSRTGELAGAIEGFLAA